MKYFASDNYVGAHPAMIEAVSKANAGSAMAYGDDPWCAEAYELIRGIFGNDVHTYFMVTGTAANVLSLKGMLRPHQGVIYAHTAHIANDECGAVEAGTGSKLEVVPALHGKIPLESLNRFPERRPVVHFVYPKVVSITQLTEVGTRYTVDEIKAIANWCRAQGFYLHMDGSRLANAAAAAGVSFAAFTSECGVDVLSLGGTKNGLMYGEAIVVINPELAEPYGHIQKQGMQLVSKMRYIGAQFTAYLQDELWRKNAAHANGAVAELHKEIKDLPGLKIVHPVEGNMIFARMHKENVAQLQKTFYFYTIDPFDAAGYPKDWHLVRLMTSFCTTPEEVREFAEAIKVQCG